MALVTLDTNLACPMGRTMLSFAWAETLNVGEATYFCFDPTCRANKVVYRNGMAVVLTSKPITQPAPAAPKVALPKPVEIRCPGGCSSPISFERSTAEMLAAGVYVSNRLKVDCGCIIGPVTMPELKARLKAALAK